MRWSTRTPLDEINREIQQRKFEATLKPRIDAEVKRWQKEQPPVMPPPIQLDDLHIRAPWSMDSSKKEQDPPQRPVS